MATPSPAKFRVLVSGASGLVGRALCGALSVPSAFNRFAPEICYLVRRKPQYDNEIFWSPYEMQIDLAKCEGFDAVVHLAGAIPGVQVLSISASYLAIDAWPCIQSHAHQRRSLK